MNPRHPKLLVDPFFGGLESRVCTVSDCYATITNRDWGSDGIRNSSVCHLGSHTFSFVYIISLTVKPASVGLFLSDATERERASAVSVRKADIKLEKNTILRATPFPRRYLYRQHHVTVLSTACVSIIILVLICIICYRLIYIFHVRKSRPRSFCSVPVGPTNIDLGSAGMAFASKILRDKRPDGKY